MGVLTPPRTSKICYVFVCFACYGEFILRFLLASTFISFWSLLLYSRFHFYYSFILMVHCSYRVHLLVSLLVSLF